MKRLLLFQRFFAAVLLLAISTLSWAVVYDYDVEIDGIYYFINDDDATAGVAGVDWDIFSYSVVIPSAILQGENTWYSVTSIVEDAFSGCTSLTSITIPNSVTNIGISAFSGCTSLTSITIPNSVTDIGGSAFSGCSGLTSVTIPNSVTSIRSHAFEYCSGLISVTIPNSVTSIGNEAFYGCSGLTSVIIPNSVTSIGQYAFSGCSGLTSVTIGNSVTSIGASAFSDCRNLTSITIPNSVTRISRQAFSGCSGLTSVTIGNSVTSIGYCAFESCSGLTSVTIPNSVKSIEYNAFNDCSGLTSVTIPNSVTSIGRYAFSDCSGLTSVTIPNSVTSIGDKAFSGCSGLTSVTLNANDIVSKTYSYDSNLGTIFGSQVKEYVLGDDVKSIGWHVFNGCSGLTSITIPNSVTSIGTSAFNGCSGLTSVTIPNSVTSIGEDAFYDCSSLTSLKVEEGNPKYDSRNNCNAIIESSTNTLIAGCKTTTIPNSVTSIGWGAFYGCSGLTSVTIPNSVTSIGIEAFSGCSGLTSVTCHAMNVPSTGNNCFSYVPQSTATLYVPSVAVNAYKSTSPWSKFGTILPIEEGTSYNITATANPANGGSITGAGSYQDGATVTLTATPAEGYEFANWTENGTTVSTQATYTFTVSQDRTLVANFQKVDEGNHIKGIYYSFNTSNNTATVISGENKYTGNVVIPETVTYQGTTYAVTKISNYAFSECTDMTSVTIPNTITCIEYYAFYGCSGLTSVIIPNSVTNMGDGVFSECLYLISVTIPNSVESIGDYAFCGCTGLTSVTIPNSVASIGAGAFAGCSSLTSVTIPNSVTSIGYEAFQYCYGLKSVTIGNSVTNIGDEAFAYCEELLDVYCLANKVPTVVTNAFDNCNIRTASLYVPSSALNVYKSTAPWSGFGTILSIAEEEPDEGNRIKGIYYSFNTSNNTATVISGENQYTGNVVIPETVTYQGTTYTVTSIDNSAFAECAGLTSVTIGNNVRSIGYAAFDGCRNLKSVTFGNNMTIIGSWAFYRCSDLTSVTIPNSVTSVGEGAFSYCSGMTSATIGNNVTSIGNSAFSYCSDLTSVTIGNSVRSIGNSAFVGCSSLTSVNIPNSVTSIASGIFWGCTSLKSITIPNSVESIGSDAFTGCESLASVTLNANNIVSRTYTASSNLKSVFGNQVTEYILGDDVTSIGDYAFHGCSDLTSVSIPNSVTSIGESAFGECTGLVSVTLNSNAIASKTYTSGSNLKTIFGSQVKEYIFGDDVTGIGNYATYGCSGLTSVTIGSGVTSIGTSSFYGCSGLKYVVCKAQNVPSTGSNCFGGITLSSATLYVPAASVNKYKSTSPWSGFGTVTSIPDNFNIWEIKLNRTEILLYEQGDTYRLTASVVPGYAANKTLRWTSSNTSVATVDANGLVTPVSQGTAVITATTLDGSNLSATCVVTVDADNVISDLSQLSNDKCYYFYTKDKLRGGLGVNKNYGSIASTFSVTNAKYKADSVSPFVVFNYNDNFYLYSVEANAFVTYNGGLTRTNITGSNAVDIIQNENGYFMISFAATGRVLNINTNPGLAINYWGTSDSEHDEGNQFTIEVAGDCDEYAIADLINESNTYSDEDIAHYSQTPVQSLSELSNAQVYTAVTYRAAWYVPASGTRLESTRMPIADKYSCSNTGQQFAFIQHNGQYYIYSVGEKKILNGRTDNNPNHGVLVTENCQPVSISETGDTQYPLFFNYGAAFNVNIDGSGNVAIDSWSTLDAGNMVALRPVQGVTLSDSEINRIIRYIDGSIPGDVNGDGEVNGADIVAVINYVLNDSKTDGDVNEDGEVNGADIVAVINYVLSYTGDDARQQTYYAHRAPERPVDTCNRLYANTVTDGITVGLTNETDFTAFQFMLQLPEDCTLENVIADGLRLDNHVLQFRRMADGRYFVLGYNLDNENIAGHDGALLRLQLAGNICEGASVTDVMFFTPEAETRHLAGIQIDLVTGLTSLENATEDVTGNIYDMQGRVVMTSGQYAKQKNFLPTGIYIRNGRKFVVK